MDSTNKKVLLMVDDSTIYMEMMSVMIGDDYDLKFATDGQKALQMLRADKEISLILLSLHMPYMSGLEFLMEAKKDPEIKDVPVIVLTVPEDNEAACLSLGAVDFIKKKPFPMRSVVVDKIEKALQSQNSTQDVDLDSYINILFSEYQTVYLIDAEDYSFDSFSEDENYQALNLKQRGDNFFEVIAGTISNAVHPEDRERMIAVFDKDTFMSAMKSQQGITKNMRLVVNGKTLHYRMKAMLVPDEKPQIMIGIANTEESVVGMETLYAFRDNPDSFSAVAQALAVDYMCIYYVHLDSNRFIEYKSVPEYAVLRLAKEGENFFTFGLKSFIEGVNPVDRDRVARQFARENVLAAIEKFGAFNIAFRMTFEDNDEYLSLKAAKLVQDGADYLVVGVRSIDPQVTQTYDEVQPRRRLLTALRNRYQS